MSRNSVISATISMIKSDFISEDMRIGYIDFLDRYVHKSKTIHKDEISLLDQEVARLHIKIVNYNEEQAKELLKSFQIYNNQETSYSKKHKQEESSTKKKAAPEKTELRNLNHIISDLRLKGKQAVASRDKWKKRAEIAEIKLSRKSSDNDTKFKQVKKTFSKMYHPDSLAGDRFEKLIKQEIFKEFWQAIEDIEKNNA